MRDDLYNVPDYDIMQHIRINLCDSIIGALSNLNMSFDEIDKNRIWVGTEEEWKVGVGNGTIPDDVICVITDDYVPVPDETTIQV